jgi:hypothetical protein
LAGVLDAPVLASRARRRNPRERQRRIIAERSPGFVALAWPARAFRVTRRVERLIPGFKEVS